MARVNRAFMHRATRWLAENGRAPVPRHRHRHPHRAEPPPDRPADRARTRASSTATTTRSCSPTRRPCCAPPPRAPPSTSRPTSASPEAILEQAGKVLDFEQPIALSLLALLHFVDDEDGAAELVDRLVDAAALRQLPGALARHRRLQPEGAAQATGHVQGARDDPAPALARRAHRASSTAWSSSSRASRSPPTGTRSSARSSTYRATSRSRVTREWPASPEAGP